MDNFSRYCKGGIVGMCADYLYRVEFNIYPLIILILYLILITFDLIKKTKKDNYDLGKV
jgi:hypothetical protein